MICNYNYKRNNISLLVLVLKEFFFIDDVFRFLMVVGFESFIEGVYNFFFECIMFLVYVVNFVLVYEYGFFFNLSKKC